MRFASVRSLFSGTALTAPPEDHDDDDTPGANAGGKPVVAGPTEAQVAAVVATERDAATAAANTRWHTVMTSEAGQASPKAAARLLNTTTMSAEDVAATLGDLQGDKPGAAAAATTAAAAAARTDAREQARADLAADPAAAVDTGGAATAPGARSGQGEKPGANLSARRAARAERRNPANGKKAGTGN